MASCIDMRMILLLPYPARLAASLSSTDLAQAFAPLFADSFGQALDLGNSNSTNPANTAALSFMYKVYQDPSIIDRRCRTAFLVDLGWLALFGVITRYGCKEYAVRKHTIHLLHNTLAAGVIEH